MKKEYLDGFLNDLEKTKLEQFNLDPVMKNAVRKVLLAGLYENGTLKKGAPTDPLINPVLAIVQNAKAGKLSKEQIGQEVSAYLEGVLALELAFTDIAKYTTTETKGPNKNPAR